MASWPALKTLQRLAQNRQPSVVGRSGYRRYSENTSNDGT